MVAKSGRGGEFQTPTGNCYRALPVSSQWTYCLNFDFVVYIRASLLIDPITCDTRGNIGTTFFRNHFLT